MGNDTVTTGTTAQAEGSLGGRSPTSEAGAGIAAGSPSPFGEEPEARDPFYEPARDPFYPEIELPTLEEAAELAQKAGAPEAAARYRARFADAERSATPQTPKAPPLTAEQYARLNEALGPTKPDEPGGDGKETPGLLYRLASEIEPVPMRWLWPDRIPLGKITLIIGDGSIGKTTITHDVVARSTARAPWPDRTENTEPGSAVILNAEDDPGDTLIPRLIAAGAVRERITIVDGVRRQTEEGKLRAGFFNLDLDLPLLEARIAELGDCRLLVIDPLSAYLGGRVNSWKDDEVRSVLAPLASLAAKWAVAVVGVMHPNKSTTATMIYRIGGSIAFGAAARVVWTCVKDPGDDEEKRRLFLPLKNNLGPDRGGLAYRVIPDPGEQPVIAWEPEAIHVDVATAMSTDPGEFPGACADAAKWLQDFLKDKPVAAQDVYRLGKEAGHAERTLRRAKAMLKVRSIKEGAVWRWTLKKAPLAILDVAALAPLVKEANLAKGQEGQEGQERERGEDGWNDSPEPKSPMEAPG